MADHMATESVEQGGSDVFDDISHFVDQTAATKSEKKTLQLVLQFLQRNRPAHERDTLMRYLSVESDPPRENMTSILPLDELAQRLELIQKIEEHLEKIEVEVSAELFAMLLFLTKQEESSESWSPTVNPTASSGTSQRGTKRKLTGKGSAGSRKKGGKKADKGDDPFDPDVRFDKDGNPIRNTLLGPQRKALDEEKCVVTGTADPDACHIIPWASCNSDVRVGIFRTCLASLGPALLSDQDYDEDVERNFHDYPAVSDKLWNMVSLNPQLRVWWGKAYFGFKCRGIFPSERNEESLVRVQFSWMPKTTKSWQQDDRNEGKLRAHLSNDQSPLADDGVVAFYPSARPVTTGDTFDIPVAEPDGKKMKMAFDIQWALIRLTALTGAADVNIVGMPPDEEGPPDTGLIERRLQGWLEQSRTFPPPPPQETAPAPGKFAMTVRTVVAPSQEPSSPQTVSPTKSISKEFTPTQLRLPRLSSLTGQTGPSVKNQKENQKP
ncbi:hypothetical protein OQA88_13247 [Cercophora sp. LCS_1]